MSYFRDLILLRYKFFLKLLEKKKLKLLHNYINISRVTNILPYYILTITFLNYKIVLQHQKETQILLTLINCHLLLTLTIVNCYSTFISTLT